jgi:hypothetical protein
MLPSKSANTGRLLAQINEFYEQGDIRPIFPSKAFPAAQIESAMRYMQKGQHIGKIIVDIPNNHEQLKVFTSLKQLVLNPDKSYLIVGGLGGLGRSIAGWFVDNGARHIVFLSRSAGSLAKDDPYFMELEAQGCSVQAFSGSVSNPADVLNVVKSVAKPIAGVLQAAMVLQVRHLSLQLQSQL